MTLKRLNVHVYKEILLWPIVEVVIITAPKSSQEHSQLWIVFFMLCFVMFHFFLSQVYITVKILLLRSGHISCES